MAGGVGFSTSTISPHAKGIDALSDADSEPEEAEPSHGKQRIDKPSEKEVEEHMRTHAVFRSWCRHCVRGQGFNDPHKRIEKGNATIPIVSIDYWIPGESKDERNDRKNGKSDTLQRGMPILVLKERQRGYIVAEVVPKKGEDPYAIKRVTQIIEELGLKKFIFKSDQEPAIISLKRAVARNIQDVEIVPE